MVKLLVKTIASKWKKNNFFVFVFLVCGLASVKTVKIVDSFSDSIYYLFIF